MSGAEKSYATPLRVGSLVFPPPWRILSTRLRDAVQGRCLAFPPAVEKESPPQWAQIRLAARGKVYNTSYCSGLSLFTIMPLIRHNSPLATKALNTTLLSAIQASSRQLLHCVQGEGDLVPFAWYGIVVVYVSGMSDQQSSRPLDEQHARVNVEMLAAHRTTHLFRYPGCICPIIHPGGGVNNETTLFIASDGEYEGRLVVACAYSACGYVGAYNISPSEDR